jgi:large subunit ribosomal protein L28
MKTKFKIIAQYLLVFFLAVPILSLTLAVFNFTYKNFEHWYFRSVIGDSVVKIMVYNQLVHVSNGTGFQVESPSGKKYIVTNNHVCSRSHINSNVTIISQKGIVFFRKILKQSEHTDLCIIEPADELPSLGIADGYIVGEPVRTIGYPASGPLVMLSGEIIGSTWLPLGIHGEPASAVMTSVFAIPGSSGSPVINIFGKVSGIVFATRNTDHTWWAYAIPSKDLITLLDEK